MHTKLWQIVTVCVLIGGPRGRSQPSPEGLAAGAVLGSMRADASPAEVVETWDRFCAAHFGAAHEPLVKERFGQKLTVNDEGDWQHVSLSSACIAWETNLPARTWLEYAQEDDPVQQTAPLERYFYIHVHWLRELRPGTRYRVRRISESEDGQRLATPWQDITTRTAEGAVLVPGTIQGPPYLIEQADTTYILDSDITAEETGIEIRAPGVTLDLNGHTVTYHTRTIPQEVFTDPWDSYTNKGAVGIRNHGQSRFTLLNGTIRQGPGQNTGNSESAGFIPVYIRSAGELVIAGVSVDYHSPQNTGMRVRSGGDNVEVHHNVFLDRGCRIDNRHSAGVRALSLLGDRGQNYRVHHNLVKRTRQMGLLGADELVGNEVYVDSWSVNSFALAPWKIGGVADHNRVFGTGVNVQGFGWGERDIRITHNLIHLQGVNTGTNRGKEGWGDRDSMNGLRVTNYGKGGQVRDNLQYSDNTIVIRCRGGSQARGTEFFSDETITNLVLRDSVIKVEAEDEQTAQVACIVTHGQPDKADTALPVVYQNLRLISNLCHVRMGDYYGKGSNHRLLDCELLRTGEDQRFHTFIVDGAYWSKRHIIRDCTFGPGVAPDNVFWKMTSPKSFYSLQWTLTVEAAAGAQVTVGDAAGETAFEGTIDGTGTCLIPLTQYVVHMPPKTKSPCLEHVKDVRTPHTLVITQAGQSSRREVTMTAAQTVTTKGLAQ